MIAQATYSASFKLCSNRKLIMLQWLRNLAPCLWLRKSQVQLEPSHSIS